MPTVPYDKSIAYLVQKYVKEHPGCRCTDISRALGLNPKSVNNRLFKMRQAGHVKRKNVGAPRSVRVTWEVGAEPDVIELVTDNPRDGAMSQTTVRTWEPHLLRDPMVALLFGQAA